MTGAALGWRTHSGWAVMVAVEGTSAEPRVVARQRVQLVDEPLPRMPYHTIEGDDLSIAEGKALIAKVRRTAITAGTKAMKTAARELGVETVGVVGKVRNVPDDLRRILVAHALLHAAEGALYEEALLDAATPRRSRCPARRGTHDRDPGRARSARQAARAAVAEGPQARGVGGAGRARAVGQPSRDQASTSPP